MLSQEFKDELMQRSDIVDVVSSYVEIKRRGRIYSGLCPFHNEKTPSFVVYPDTQSFYCFGCGVGGDVITFIRKIENLDYIESVRLLAARAGMEVPEDSSDGPQRSRKRLLEANRQAARFFCQCLNTDAGREARGYLRSRGLSDSTIRRFGIGYAPAGWSELRDHLKSQGYRESELLEAGLCAAGRNGSVFDFFRNRVMFPVIDIRGNVVAFSGRRLRDQDSPRKYVNTGETPVFKKSSLLFAMNIAKNSGTRSIVLAEGQMDAIAMHQAGVDNAVAALGTALTPEHARLISRYADEVVIAYDSDEAGRKATERAISIFKQTSLAVRVLTIKGAKDADEFIKKYGPEGFRELLQGSDNSIEYQLKAAAEGIDLSSDRGVVDYLARAAGILSRCPSSTERDVYAGRLSEQLGVSKKAILNQAAELYRRRSRDRDKQQKKAMRDVASQYSLKPYESQKLGGASAEQRMLALLFLNPDLAGRVREGIEGVRFSDPSVERIFSAMLQQIDSGEFSGFQSLSSLLDNDQMSKLSGAVAAVNGINFSKEDVELLTKRLRGDGSPSSQQIKQMSPEEIKSMISGGK